MRVTVLSSGSKGNCVLVHSGSTTVMFDAGIGPRNLKHRMGMVGVDPRSIQALFISHGHHDHVKWAAHLGESLRIPTFATNPCAWRLVNQYRPLYAHQTVKNGEVVQFGSLRVTPFNTPHDYPGSVGFVFEDDDARFGGVTDLGCFTEPVIKALSDLDMLYLEFNHDVKMLMEGAYPNHLKRRIRSNVGHLSNEQAAELVRRCRGTELRHLVLAHLSEHNNTAGHALRAARSVLDGSNTLITVAPQALPLPPLEVRASFLPRRRPWPSLPVSMPQVHGHGSGPAAQLALFR